MNTQAAFIIGTGRCGSTLLSKMINAYAGITSVSEFFSMITDLGTMIPEAFPEGPVSGAAFWNILSGIYPKQNTMLRHGVAMKEVLYTDRPDAAFRAATGVPALLQTTLPHLTEDHDALFEALAREVSCWPSATVAVHYQQFMQTLCRQFGDVLWVERSGGSLRIVHRLYEAFPRARYVHLVRDGRNCALSMEKHLGFRMAMLSFQMIEVLGVDPYLSDDREFVDDLPDELVDFLPENFNPEAFRNYSDTQASLFGHYWSGELIQGLETLQKMPAEQLLTVSYEDLLEYPERTFRTIIEFLAPDRVDMDQIREVCRLVGRPRSDWQALPKRERELLARSCEPGFMALEANVH
ncbi:sulfotransferase [Flavilitoribacter nigricans]|nr:sulfotransferase [Flavilitoribacter nigricans]